MDLSRLLDPRTIAVVGATPREDTYAHETLRNLELAGFPGEVWGVHPTHRVVRGREVFPSLAELPEPADAVVIAVGAGAVPGLVAEAGAAGCGGAVVYAAGFAEDKTGAGADLQAELRAAALAHDFPVCGPNCDGIVRLHGRVALWGDALRDVPAGPVGLIAQSGNVAVNALGASRGLRLHTVVSCGNQAVLDAVDFLDALADEADLRSVALFLESDGDGDRLCDALARCADAGVRVAILKVGASAVGASAAAAHTGSVAGDHRVFRSLVEEAGAAWATDLHELLELAKALATPSRAAGGGVAVVTCSGGDCGMAADEAEALGIDLPRIAPETAARINAVLPAGTTAANPLDYTAQIWGEIEPLKEMVGAMGSDPAIGQVLVIYDEPPGIEGWAGESWRLVRSGILAGAVDSPVPTVVCSTLPDLLLDESAGELLHAGIPAIAGLEAGLRATQALRIEPADPGRLREIAAAVRTPAAGDGSWLAEHDAKALLAGHGVAVCAGRIVRDADDAAAAAAELGFPVVAKASSAALQHKTEAGALALDLCDAGAVRAAYERLAGLNLPAGTEILIEQMAAPGVELLVSARRDAVVPALVVGLGGTWTELLADAAVVPLPASAERVAAAIRTLRGAPLLTGGRGRPPLDVEAAARLAAAAGAALLAEGLDLIELNPVIVSESGAIAVDAVARRGTSPASVPAAAEAAG